MKTPDVSLWTLHIHMNLPAPIQTHTHHTHNSNSNIINNSNNLRAVFLIW